MMNTPKPKKIEPRTLKGFRDFLPETMIPREMLMSMATDVFKRFGYCPIDTPVLEYMEILSGKGSDETDKQLYQFHDHGGRHVGMRFDLTVPFARFAAQHLNEIGVPFKRYHIAKVWRGENTQAGRYREFFQCDFDAIGTKSIVSDIETAMVINELLEHIDLTAKHGETFSRFTIHINNRRVLTGLLETLNLADKSVAVLRCLDKMGKIGKEKVAAELQEFAHTTAEQTAKILDFAAIGEHLDSSSATYNDTVLTSLSSMLCGNETGKSGVAALEELVRSLRAVGLPPNRVVLDLSIARGLDYYTGTIYETFLTDKPGIGSVCSGGRYDNLAEMYTHQELPGVGASLGLDRLLAAMEELGMLPKTCAPAMVFLPFFVEHRLTDYLAIATTLRRAGVSVELYPEPKKLGHQLKFADKRGFPFAVILGEDEFTSGNCQVKNLSTGESQTVVLTDLATMVLQVLSCTPRCGTIPP